MLLYSLEAPGRGTSNEYLQHMFSWRNKKNIIWIPLLLIWTIGFVKPTDHRLVRLVLIDDQLALQNQWSTVKFWQIPNTTPAMFGGLAMPSNG